MDDKQWVPLPGFIEPFRVKPGSRVVLGKDFDPSYKADLVSKDMSDTLLQEGVERLRDYQARLAAQNSYGVLVIVQALDAAGKDGTISHVMSGMNPLGVYAYSFKAPSAEELDHDYLWRCAKRLPARGEIAVFNRSYYEEVLVVKVHPQYLDQQRLPASAKRGDIWKRRYREINAWEKYLYDNGFRIVKLFLNVSRDEQRRRFLDRIDTPDKNWKFSPADVAEREHWDEYQEAFGEMLSNTSTRWAPWHVLPADHKWFTHIAASAVIVHALADIHPEFPVMPQSTSQELLAAKSELEGELGLEHHTEPAEAQSEETAGPVTARLEDEAAVASGAASLPTAKPIKTRLIRPGEIEIMGDRYRTDVIIEGGKVRQRRKKASKALRDQYGHTPLTTAEEIPWGDSRLIVGTGYSGALPITADVFAEARDRGVEIIAVPLAEALELLGTVDRKEAFAVLHVGC